MAALRLCRTMRLLPTASPPILVLIRAFSSAAAARSEGEAPGIQYCYALGEFGRIPFDRRLFLPIKQVMRNTPAFEAVPDDRLIDGVDPMCPTLTSEFGKDWIRSGYLAPFFANKLGWTIKDAFVDGNVGVISGLNIIAFLNLDISPSSSSSTVGSVVSSSVPEKYPMLFSDFSDFLSDIVKEVYGISIPMLPPGLQELMMMTRDPAVADYMVIYHPEFLPLEGIAALYLQGWRVLRREMPALGEALQAHIAVVKLDNMFGPHYYQICLADNIIKCWLGVHTPKAPTVPGVLGLSGASSKMNIKALTKHEWSQLKALLKKLYFSGVIQASPATSGTYTTSSGLVIPKNPKEAAVLDVHRHCTAHVIEDESVKAIKKLKPEHQRSFQKKAVEWQDGVRLMMHRFPRFPHCVVTVFNECKIWGRLSMEVRLPIPRVFSSPSLDKK